MADSPSEAEGAQAIFCYIADVLGKSKIKEWDVYLKEKTPSYEDFQVKYKTLIKQAYSSRAVETSKGLSTIETFLIKNPDWFKSSLLIAKKLIEDIASAIDKDFNYIQRPRWNNVFYKHGDEKVMGTIAKLFKIANDNEAKKLKNRAYFGNINKWSPADIYFATKEAINELNETLKEQISVKSLSFNSFNQQIGKLVDKGQLLPLSLKKTTTEAHLVKVNFTRKAEESILGETFVTGVGRENPGVNQEPLSGASFNTSTGDIKYDKKKIKGNRDIYIRIKSGGGRVGVIQFRHVPAANGKPAKSFKVILKYKGSDSLGGQVNSPILCSRIMSTADPRFASQLESTFNSGYRDFEAAANKYIKKMGAKLYKTKATFPGTSSKIFDEHMGYLSGVYLMNKVNKLIQDKFKNAKATQHELVRSLFEYVSSRTPLSSKFVIAK